jgi:agmatinase
MLHIVTREGLAGMELVEVSPPYDVAEVTSILGVRVINDVLATLVTAGKLGRIPLKEPGPPVEESPAE